ncbi:MAG: hypothetical protein KJ939_07575, partial [Nanoarchaeota archaeon]|nr:hypothetical protein [Nanoarchaeota archaeon]
MLVAVDAAGGDYAPHEIVKGALAAAEQFGIEVALVGRKTSLRMLERRLNIKSSLQIFNKIRISFLCASSIPHNFPQFPPTHTQKGAYLRQTPPSNQYEFKVIDN